MSEVSVTRDSGGWLHSVDDAPAVVTQHGARFWYNHGLQHRKGGPAVEMTNGDREWWVNGRRISALLASDEPSTSLWWRTVTALANVADNMLTYVPDISTVGPSSPPKVKND